MAICRQKRGNKVYLYKYKSVREGKKVRHKFEEYLGVEGPDGKPIRKPRRIIDRVRISSARAYGGVAVLWRLCQEIGIEDVIDSLAPKRGFPAGRLLSLLAINRCLRPVSLTKLPAWYGRTELPELAGLSTDAVSKDNLLSAMDAVCGEDEEGEYDATLPIEKALFERCRRMLPKKTFSSLLYDLTTTIYNGGKCVLAELGRTPKGSNKKRIGVALVVTRQYHIPIFHMVFRGGIGDARTVGRMLDIAKGFGLRKITLVWDRGLASATNIRWAEEQKFGLICGLRKDLLEVERLLQEIEVREDPGNFVKRFGNGGIYAVGVKTRIFGRMRKAAVYLNTAKREAERLERNAEIKKAVRRAGELSGKKTDEAKVKEEVERILRPVAEYVDVSYRRKGGKVVIDCRVNEKALERAARRDGKYVLMSTELSMSAEEIVDAYFGKSEIERVFRVMKQVMKVEPVRFRLSPHAKVHFFVCVLAYLLYAMLEYRLRKRGVIESVEEVLGRLDEVEKIVLKCGAQTSVRYLNVGVFEREVLSKLGMGNLCPRERIDRTKL